MAAYIAVKPVLNITQVALAANTLAAPVTVELMAMTLDDECHGRTFKTR
jgi:hypothetical protein